MIDFPLYSKIVFLVAYMVFSLGLITFLGTKDKGSRAFALAIWATGLWILSRGFFHGTENATLATEINKVSFFLANITGVLFFRFGYMFPDNKKIPKYLTLLLVLSVAVFIPFFLYESLAVGKVFPVEGIQKWGWEQGKWLPLHDLHFIGLTSLALIYFYWKVRNYSLKFKRGSFIILGIVMISAAPMIVATTILPRFFDIFSYDWISSLSIIVWISILSYVIARYNKINTKTILTALLVFIATGLLFINIFIY